MTEQKYFDDFNVGDQFTTPGVTVTESEIIDFALKYDPQPFHLDVNTASESQFGGLIASGYQTLALCFRLFIQSGLLLTALSGRWVWTRHCYL